MDQAKRLLIVEDEGIIAADLAARLERLAYAVVGTAASADEAVAAAMSLRPDLVLMDIVLQGPQTGIAAAKRIRDVLDIPVVFVTSHADATTVRSALGAAPFGYVLKPFNERELQAVIEIGLYRHQTENKLHKMERWLATTLSSIGDAVIATDTTGCITLINPVAQRLTGYGEGRAIGQPLHAVFHVVDTTTRVQLTGLVERALVEGLTIGVDEPVALLPLDGPEIPIDDSIAPIRDESGGSIGVVVVFRDASVRIAAQQAMQAMQDSLEQRVVERTEQLASANRTLTSFAASVSHDLRAPLRAVDGLSSVLQKRYAHVLDAEGARFLGMLKAKSRQMEQMIQGYLDLFRLRQDPLSRHEVDMNLLVANVVAELQSQNPRARYIEVDPLPTVVGDAALVRQVWVNLLTNALKFTSTRERPEIHVSASVDAGAQLARFQVSDNGVGFNMAHAAKLFGLFQRLHSEREFEGYGIGLAIVRAVVERHGGKVQALGVPDRGATLSFSLPTAR